MNTTHEPAPTTQELFEITAEQVNALTPEEAQRELENLDATMEAAAADGYQWSDNQRRFLSLSYALCAAGRTLVPPPRQ